MVLFFNIYSCCEDIDNIFSSHLRTIGDKVAKRSA